MNKKNIETELLKQSGNIAKIQQNQLLMLEEQLDQMQSESNYLTELNTNNLEELDKLILEAEGLCFDNNIEIDNLNEIDYNIGSELSGIKDIEDFRPEFSIIKTDLVEFNEKMEWSEYLKSIDNYATKNKINLKNDPFYSLLGESHHNEIIKRLKKDYYAEKVKCDKYDYIIASFCGIAAGVIDSIFVGMPMNSKLGNWSNDITDKFIINFAKISGWNPNSENSDKIGHAISFFERRYPVNYEQATSESVNNLFGMNLGNHHIKSLSHAPDIVGLIFSIIDQFTSTSHFLDNGRLIVIDTNTFDLKGKNFIAKIFCGFTNWLGHIISDMAGSSTGRKNNPDLTGSGVSIPFFELLQGVGIGSIGKEEKLTIADAAVKMFESGYDARFGIAMSIPVLFNELSVRLCWMLKQYLYHKQPLKKCIPIILFRELKDSESNVIVLRRMLLASYGCLCSVDAGDAAIRSKGDWLKFALHINFIAWKKFAVNLAITGLMELRLNYKINHIDIKKLDKDLEKEWNKLYVEIT